MHEARHIENTERERACGGGRKPALKETENMLLFILFYLKLYPLQELAGFLFGMGQSQANEWIHRLTEVLRTALSEAGHLPDRDPQNLKKTLAGDGEKDFVIDGTDREIQRPKDIAERKKFYSGGKKMHALRNIAVVSAGGRKVKYLNGTSEGKKHDRKICDDEHPAFPEGIRLYKDKGFQTQSVGTRTSHSSLFFLEIHRYNSGYSLFFHCNSEQGVGKFH